jgi:hypothetical protein
MTDDLRARFGPEYDAAFSRYLARPGEAGLAVAYEIAGGPWLAASASST